MSGVPGHPDSRHPDPGGTMSDDDDGRHDFDFVPGVWQMHHRKLVNALDPECDEWVEFDSVCTGDIRLYGLGNTDRMLVESMPPDGRPYEGMTLRLFDARDVARLGAAVTRVELTAGRDLVTESSSSSNWAWTESASRSSSTECSTVPTAGHADFGHADIRFAAADPRLPGKPGGIHSAQGSRESMSATRSEFVMSTSPSRKDAPPTVTDPDTSG